MFRIYGTLLTGGAAMLGEEGGGDLGESEKDCLADRVGVLTGV